MNQDILIGLIKNKSVYNKLIREFPGLYTASLTIQQNISKENVDKAVTKLINFYNTNEQFKTFIHSFQKDINSTINNNISNSMGENVAGLVVILDKKEESYKKLMETAKKEQWQYKGIAIVDQFENIRLYFY